MTKRTDNKKTADKGNGFQTKLPQDVFNKLFKKAIDKKSDVNTFIEGIMKKYDVKKSTVIGKMKNYREASDPIFAIMADISGGSGRVPTLQKSGKHVINAANMTAAGFKVGDKLNYEISDGSLIITKL